MNPIFVFGSNRAGKHLGGAARHAAERHGAVFGCGEGLQGNSYAIPTMDADFKPLTLNQIAKHVATFLVFARSSQHLTFHVTAIGCGIAGFDRKAIIPLFDGAPDNCFFFEPEFGKAILAEDQKP